MIAQIVNGEWIWFGTSFIFLIFNAIVSQFVCDLQMSTYIVHFVIPFLNPKMENFSVAFFASSFLFFPSSCFILLNEPTRTNGPTSYYVSHFSGGNRDTIFIMKFMLRTTTMVQGQLRFWMFARSNSLGTHQGEARQGRVFSIIWWCVCLLCIFYSGILVPMLPINLMCMSCVSYFLYI